MTATVPAEIAESGSHRILADVRALGGRRVDERAPALVRLEEVLGRDLADRLVSALSEEHDRRDYY
jgi:hypothetical protein